MGIYTNGTIYGILIYNFVDDIANNYMKENMIIL